LIQKAIILNYQIFKIKIECGPNKPSTVVSEDNFFQIIFKSNEIFDGKGFQASFQFINFLKLESNA
jgi:hypothetical protein